ncbi:MAG: polyprenyl synthetase family protein [Myxococcota bacterium]
MESSPPSSQSPVVTTPTSFHSGPPLDWPSASPDAGPIDLARHDLPHASSLTEWWYSNAHLTLVDGREVSLFAAFFRIVAGRDEETHEPRYAHSLSWGLSDLAGKRFSSDTLVDPASPRLGLERLDRADVEPRGSAKDPRVRRALREMLERGQVPYPDRMLEKPAYVGERRLELDYDGNRFEKTDEGHYRLRLWNEHAEVGVELELVPVPGKGPIRHGANGVVRGPDGSDMFYYFIPRLQVVGHVLIGGARVPVAEGQAWYDHEFGGQRADDAGAAMSDDVAWNWCSLQLDDGSEVTAYSIIDLSDGRSLVHRAIVVDADGGRHEHAQFSFTPGAQWRSTRTFNSYPTQWQLEIPEAGLICQIDATFPDQEVVTLISKPAFWEGRVSASGTRRGKPVSARGYVERSGYVEHSDLEEFFRSVGKEVRKSVARLLPDKPSFEVVRDLMASEERSYYMDGVDLDAFERMGMRPVREITDRGGKGWRSYAALACCDVVGGDSRKYAHWLAMPELLHVGSLIVDDVQDRSTVRRGGPAAHVVHGDALAINAGTSCYFMGQQLLHSTEVSDARKLRLYHTYFEALRAGHAGQAFDIGGLWGYVPKAVESGDVAELESRVLAIHRRKTAAPAGALARMGAIVGGGSEAQIEGLGRFFESIGLAFQMVDDVLNLRGFAGDLKLRGEDIAHGKVTLPVVVALGRLGAGERQRLMAAIERQPQTQAEIDAVIAVIDGVGALDATSQAAADLVESAWQALDPLLEPSIVKLMLRAFGWFVLQRHY